MLKNKNLLTSLIVLGVLVLAALACKNSEQKPPVSTPTPGQSSSPTGSASTSSYGNKVKIKTTDDKPVVEISFDASGAKIEFGGKTVRSESKDAEKRKYFNGSTQLAEVKMKDADGFKVRTVDGKLLWKVKIDGGKIKISDNEENQNAYELVKRDDGAKIEQNETKLGEVKFYTDRQKIKVKDASDKELFDGNTDKYSMAYGVLLLDKIPEEQRYIIIAELLARNL